MVPPPQSTLENWGNYVVTPGGMGLEHHLLRQPVVVGGGPAQLKRRNFKELGRPMERRPNSLTLQST